MLFFVAGSCKKPSSYNPLFENRTGSKNMVGLNLGIKYERKFASSLNLVFGSLTLEEVHESGLLAFLGMSMRRFRILRS